MVKPKLCYAITACQPCHYNQSCSGIKASDIPVRESSIEKGPSLDQMLAKLPDEEHFTNWVYNRKPRSNNPLSFFWAWDILPPKVFEERFIIPYKKQMGYD
jgi:hypothetical protein